MNTVMSTSASSERPVAGYGCGLCEIRKSEFGILDKEGNDMNKLMTAIAAALVAMMFAAPVHAQNCQTFYNPALPITGIQGNDRHYKCYQRFVWFNQGKGSWCARDWYRSCMHSGLHNDIFNEGGNVLVMDPNLAASGDNLASAQSPGWKTGYTVKDKSKAAPQRFYASGGQIIVVPYVCRGSLKKTPEDPGQRIQSNDAQAEYHFPNPTLSEIRQYKTSGSCGGCPAAGNQQGTGC